MVLKTEMSQGPNTLFAAPEKQGTSSKAGSAGPTSSIKFCMFVLPESKNLSRSPLLSQAHFPGTLAGSEVVKQVGI